MIFASDLDRTLIYSKRAMLVDMNDQDFVVVEYKNGEPLSYMTSTAIEILKKLAETTIFIPVTTRSIEQYKRIHLFQETIKPEYAITSNGGTVLINGCIDEEWSSHIQLQLKISADKEDILKKFKEIASDDWILSTRIADETFYFMVIDPTKIPLIKFASFCSWIITQGWTHSVQGRKLYIVPECVNKWSSIEYLKQKSGQSFVYAAGDSLLDLCLLEKADEAMRPAHGELQVVDSKNIHKTSKSGIYAANEILEKGLELAGISVYPS
jgi:hydroxymethylpyrimidine pyrophosphatase-like HAD family hydrolase